MSSVSPWPLERVLTLTLRNARVWPERGRGLREVVVRGGRVSAVLPAGTGPSNPGDVDLEGRWLLPGLFNGHDHLDFSTFPPLGRPPYEDVYEWARDVDGGRSDPRALAALQVPLQDRLFLGILRNLLAGITAVAHHNDWDDWLGSAECPLQVLRKYGFAHSPGLTPDLRSSQGSTRPGWPWMVHAAEGTSERCRREIRDLAAAGLLQPNTVLVHGVALVEEDIERVARAHAALVWCPESNYTLYGATATVARCRAAGVRLALGSDSPVSGVRDPLSNLSVSRRQAGFTDDDLLRLATRDTASALGLPGGAVQAGAVADLLAVASVDDLLAGARSAVSLVLVDGRACYGEDELLDDAPGNWGTLRVEGKTYRLEAAAASRLGRLLVAHPCLQQVAWLADVRA